MSKKKYRISDYRKTIKEKFNIAKTPVDSTLESDPGDIQTKIIFRKRYERIENSDFGLERGRVTSEETRKNLKEVK